MFDRVGLRRRRRAEIVAILRSRSLPHPQSKQVARSRIRGWLLGARIDGGHNDGSPKMHELDEINDSLHDGGMLMS